MRQQPTFNDRSGFLIGLVALTVCLQIVSVGVSIVNEIRLQRAVEAVRQFAEDLEDI